MTVAKVVVAQRDFSAGELIPQMKRADDNPVMKTGARQMRNWRITNSRGIANRPGRRALFLDGPRTDEVLMSPGNTFFLSFGNGYLRVRNLLGTVVFDSANVSVKPAWTTTDIPTIVWDVYRFTIYITYGLSTNSNQPLVLTWDGVSQSSTWTLSKYSEDVNSSGQKRTVFYRLSPQGITLQPTPPTGGSVNALIIQNRGSGFSSVPTVTISAPGAGGTTATASATLSIQSIAIVSAGQFATNPTGGILVLPNGINLLVLSSSGGFFITGVSVVSGTLTSGSAPTNPVSVIGTSGGMIMVTPPSFNIVWQLNTLSLTNGGGSGYLTNPTVTLSPTSGASVTATISSTGTLNTTLAFSAGMTLTNDYIGTRIRFTNRQILITGVTSPTAATGVIEEPLYPSGIYGTTNNSNLNLFFSIGQEVIGGTSNAKAIVTAISSDGLQMTVQYINGSLIVSGETVAGPAGSLKIDKIISANLAPVAVTVWDDEVMNNLRGWPRSCFVDKGRLGLCDFPALPGMISWSFQGNFTDQYTDANNVSAVNAIQELVPGKSRVQHVIPGAEGSEFVFCDNAVYYIPINQTTPLQPGSVAFNTLIADGAEQVKPQRVQQSIVYVAAGDQQLRAVQPIGAYTRPYIIDDITELHGHLINNPVAIAAPGGSSQFEERYLYLVNADGSMMVGKYNITNGIIDPKTMGWVPWSGEGTATWVSARGPDVIMTGTYAPNSITAVSVVEILDKLQYVDASILYNAVPTGITTPNGKGPLWWLAGGTVDLMDGQRMMGTYGIDANGFLVAQNNAGENFTSGTLSCGQAWTATFEPFVPPVQPGQDVNQRLRKRRIQRHEVYVKDSSGFVLARLFGGPVTRTSPAIGTILKQRRITAWNQDDDPTLAPPLREQSYSDRPTGRLHDPRVAVIKDTPGPLTILEDDIEVSV